MRYSEQQAFNQCPYKYKLEQEGLKRQEDVRSAHHKLWGQAIHAALEKHYQGFNFQAVEEAFLAVYPRNLDDADLAKTSQHGVEVLRRYVAFYAVQDDVWEVLDTEHEGTVELGGSEDHGLHIDLVARHRQTGEIYFWDHKTTGKAPSAAYWKTFEISAQVTRYTAYVKEKYGSCAGCYINNISLKYLKRKNVYGEGPGLVVNFERQLFNRTPQQVAFWKRSDDEWMRLIEFCKKENTWPKALGGLCAYCDFYDLCLASGDEQIKGLLYGEEQFNVEVE